MIATVSLELCSSKVHRGWTITEKVRYHDREVSSFLESLSILQVIGSSRKRLDYNFKPVKFVIS